MRLSENIRGAVQILTRNKIRSFLTMLGIIIGVTAVVVIMSVGAGAQGLVLNQVKGLGSNLVGILPGKSEGDGPPAAAFGIVITTLTAEDAKALVSPQFPHIVAATPYVRGSATASAEDQETTTAYVGVSEQYPDVENAPMHSGRFFTEEDNSAAARVAVLGSEVARDLFGDEDAVGKEVKIKRLLFRVIGVVAERGVSGFQNQDNQIFVPVSTAQKLLLGIDHVNFIRVKIDDSKFVDRAIDDITWVLRDRHGIEKAENDDFSVRSSNQGLAVLMGITNGLRFFLAAIAAISLVVGGIGIMNIMLAAVEERTREIGLRKAVGATNINIVVQFLVETVIITFTGGAMGIIIGSGISVAVAMVARAQGYAWDLVIAPSSIFIGCSVSVIIGLIFGIIPARRAAALHPIDALRYE